MSDEHHMNLLSSWDEDLFALERNFPEEYAPYRMAIRIAALDATVARLTAPVTEEEADRTLADLPAFDDYTSADAAAALTAFLERRMKG